MNNMTSKRLAFVELTHIFNNQIKLPYSTGCIWSYCRTDKEISDNYSFDVNDWVYIPANTNHKAYYPTDSITISIGLYK